jgi:multidrug efflux pump
MPQFFIDRPVFAWVIALFIILAGIIAIPKLPIARFPPVAPTTVSISASYPGATPQTMNDAVVSLIERELSGVKNIMYFESVSDSSGSASVTVTFKPGTNPEMAQVDVQNKLKAIEPRLPQTVRQNGLSVDSAASLFLMIIGLKSDDGRLDEAALNGYMKRNIIEELERIEGVGRVQLFGSDQAMRIWVDPAKLISYGLSMSDLTTAIGQQNVQIAPGSIGAAPALSGQRVTVPLTVQSQLSTPEAFAAIVLRANTDGSRLALGDVARIELGSESYGFINRENGKVATAAAVQLSPGANAVRTAEAITARMAELSRSMPAGMSYSIPFNTAPFVKISIEQVLHTLVEAMLLVVLVMFLFLQNLRYTLIPAIVAPIALLGTFAAMYAIGFSINVLTMFGMVLAIGLIVDDAIVVVENVERIMAEEGLSPRDATIKAMREITGAVIGITLVLTAVFIPMTFASGSVGEIYKQFSLSMAVSILLSAFLALTLTPALCAALLKPTASDAHNKRGFFGWFNRHFEYLLDGYEVRVRKLIALSGRVMAVFLALCAVLLFSLRNLPSSFLPEEDQGYFMAAIQLPADATLERTLDVVGIYEKHIAARAAIISNFVTVGFGFSGSGSNTAQIFSTLDDWGKRNGATPEAEAALVQQAMAGVTDGSVTMMLPPAIDDLGTSSGFTLRLQDRSNQGPAALKAATAKLLELAAQSQLVSGVYPDSLPAGAGIRLDIDRSKAEALGLSFDQISHLLSTAMGSNYVNDFPNSGRMEQVIVQAEASSRMQIDDVLKLYVRNASGDMVPLSEVATPVWSEMPRQLFRYQGFPAIRISGNAVPGVSSGAAMVEMERLAAQLPPGFAVAWTGQSLEERRSASQAPMLIALSMLVIFLVLAALYESWSIPLSVMLVVPLGLLGAVVAVLLRGMPNDIFFKVGMITVIGLSAKNAILIVEFAKQLRAEGGSLVEAAVTAARLRLRPIVMTSLAFGLGVVPLMVARGASAATQHAIGTGVFGGVLTGTLLAIFFVPVFFIVVMSLQERLQLSKNSQQSAIATREQES